MAVVPSANLVPKGGQQQPKKLSAMYCKRHDYGWEVLVPGHPSEFFGDSKHGGQVAAFRKARQRAVDLADRSRVNLKTGRFARRLRSLKRPARAAWAQASLRAT